MSYEELYYMELVFFDADYRISKRIRLGGVYDFHDVHLAETDRNIEFGSSEITKAVSMWHYRSSYSED